MSVDHCEPALCPGTEVLQYQSMRPGHPEWSVLIAGGAGACSWTVSEPLTGSATIADRAICRDGEPVLESQGTELQPGRSEPNINCIFCSIRSSFPPFLSLSLSPSLPPSLPPFLSPSLPPSLPASFPRDFLLTRLLLYGFKLWLTDLPGQVITIAIRMSLLKRSQAPHHLALSA